MQLLFLIKPCSTTEADTMSLVALIQSISNLLFCILKDKLFSVSLKKEFNSLPIS